ncbi:MAG: MEKHLA domain-containing protein [Candidatus Competibacter sp.]|nr:MEKHLA domain-containing protein [Candidatus Competibacter sp.]
MPPLPEPSPANDFLAAHVARLQASLRHWTGRELTDGRLPISEQARCLFDAPFALLSHDAAPDPVFTYVNRTAMALWDMDWTEMTRLPSRLSAEPMEQAARARFLADVKARGFVDGYEGVRISKRGRRFRIRDALLWNLLDDMAQPCGQAALFADWQFLP